jgi:glutaminyl-tRNA synthetase
MNLNYTVLSKRKLIRLVKEGHVHGWDDPRMPTLRGLRRRGFTADSIRSFVTRAGVAKNINARSGVVVDVALLEACIRDELNMNAPRRMAVLHPLKVVLDNYPEGQVEQFEAVNNPEQPSLGTRPLPFTRELYIERDDFREVPPAKYYRLFPGNEVRLRYAYLIRCTQAVKNDKGEVVELHATYDPATRGGDVPDGRKVKSTIHWISAANAVPAEMRLYDRLFVNPDPEASGDFIADINPNSLEVLTDSLVEPSLASIQPGTTFQFERLGYFCADPDTGPGNPVFNRTVTLRDTWAKIEQKQAQ